jgi:hypothetical protein
MSAHTRTLIEKIWNAQAIRHAAGEPALVSGPPQVAG